MKAGLQALGRLKSGAMNKSEAAYARHLDGLMGVSILWYRFEGITVRLADNTRYTGDFAVMRSDGLMEIHDVKGQWTDDAKVKIKVAADQYPFKFVAVRMQTMRDGGGWTREEF